MGNRPSSNLNDDPGAARSAAIDRWIEEDSEILKKECKILLLGKSLSFNLHNPRSEYGFGRSVVWHKTEPLLSPIPRSLQPWGMSNVGQPGTSTTPSSDQLLRSSPTNEQLLDDGLMRCSQGPENQGNRRS